MRCRTCRKPIGHLTDRCGTRCLTCYTINTKLVAGRAHERAAAKRKATPKP